MSTPDRSAEVTAADLYRQLQELNIEFEALHAAGRLSMSRDGINGQWTDLEGAVAAIRSGLDVAIQAMAWMDTKMPR